MTADQHSELTSRYFQARDELLALCTVLEQIADSLPNKIDRQTCMYAARALVPLMDRAHRLEEDVLFPAMKGSGPIFIDLKATVERLKLEHLGDEYFAEELAETLVSYSDGDPLHGAETTGYMLRGFFESVRRHMAFEKELLEPLLAPGKRGSGQLDN